MGARKELNKQIISPCRVAEMVRAQFRRFPEKVYRPILIKDPKKGSIMGFGMISDVIVDGNLWHMMVCFGSEDQKQVTVMIDNNYQNMFVDGHQCRCIDLRLQIKGPAARILSMFDY